MLDAEHVAGGVELPAYARDVVADVAADLRVT
jgi:hypothetical protein